MKARECTLGFLKARFQFLHRGAVLGGVVELLEVDFDARSGDVGQFGFGVEEGGVVVGDCGGGHLRGGRSEISCHYARCFSMPRRMRGRHWFVQMSIRVWRRQRIALTLARTLFFFWCRVQEEK